LVGEEQDLVDACLKVLLQTLDNVHCNWFRRWLGAEEAALGASCHAGWWTREAPWALLHSQGLH